MSGMDRLTEEAIRSMLERRAARAQEGDLVPRIAASVSASNRRHRGDRDRGRSQHDRRLILVAAAALLAALLAGTVLVGSQPRLRAEDDDRQEPGRYTNGLLAWDRGDEVLFVSPDGTEPGGGVAGSAGLYPLGWAPGGSTLLLGGGQGLFLSDPRTRANPVLLWNGEVWAVSWSPDGDRLALIRAGSTPDDTIGVEVIGRDGRVEETWRLPTTDRYQDEFGRRLAVPVGLTWAPDGTALAAVVCVGPGCFTDPDVEGSDLVVMASDRSKAKVLLTEDALMCCGTWSPAGRWIAYVTPEGLSVVDVETGETRVIEEGAREPEWSPDGKRLAYVIDGSQIGATLEDGSLQPAAEPITSGSHGLGEVHDPQWSGDGASIAFSSYDRRQTHKVVDIWVVGDDGQGERRIVEGGPIGPGAPWVYWEHVAVSTAAPDAAE